MTDPQPQLPRISRPCPRCRYELAPLPASPALTCPECGGTFAREAILSFDPHLSRSRRLFALLCLTPVVMAASGALTLLLLGGWSQGSAAPVLFLTTLGGGFLWSLMLEHQLIVNRSRQSGTPRPRTLIAVEAAAFAAAWTTASGIVLLLAIGLLTSGRF